MAGRRSNRAGPAFSGNNLIQSNPLPPLTAIPSFSYGSPQSALPKPMSARDTKVNMTDALDRADAAAKARLEAAAKERKLAEQRAADAAAAAESARQSARQISEEPPMTARKRSLRSQSVVSQDDNFYEGDETSLEIHRIIESARNPVPEASMLRARSANAGTKEPRSAMKGSREEALRPSAKTRAKYTAGSRRTVPMTPVPIDGERDVTFDEENQALGIAPRLASPSFVSPSPAPQPLHEDVPPAGNDVFNNRQNSPPDTVGYNEGISNLPMSPASPNDDPSRPKTSLLISQQASVTTSWFSPAKTGLNSIMGGIQKTAVILGIFFRNLFGPLLYYLLLGFFIFGITTLSYNFIQRSSYSTSTPPSSSDELIYRLMALEKQVVEFQKGQELEKKSYKTMEQQLVSIRGAMATYSSVSSQLDKHTRNYQTDRRASSAAMSTMSAQIDQFDRSIKRNDEAAKEQQGNLKIVASQVTEIQGEIEGINKGIQILQKSQELSERAFQRIEESLPKQLAARVDPQTGKLIVAPELLRYLQTVLREDIQNEMIRFAQTHGGSSAAVRSNSDSYNWQDFLKTNAAKLQGYIGDISEEKWRKAISDGIVVTREDMMKVIREQLDSARGVAERNNNDLMRKLVLEAEGVANNAASRAATSISSAALAAVTNYMRNFQGSSSTSSRYGDALIQAALHQYSATILQKPDYALLAHGTLIDPRLTSSTYDPYDTPGLLGKLTAFLRPGPNEPAHILTESTNVGDCWSFPQASGQVSLLLAEPIYPTDVTIDHVPRGISGDVSSAPQEIEVWVKIEDEFLRDQAGKAASVAIGEVSDNASTRHYLANGYVRVASFIYDINSQYPIQTFALPIELEKLGVSVRSVSFRILSNWGRKEYTSIYRLRVHGITLKDQFEGQETAARI
ncbi:hypothetical protein AOL_s00006g31 [Orbilia oligospora ATCC 24927]|uniref:SUN domain-containing protein n=2 Tax=Orbilia oligospora TaxID=2813651 RepID=G1WZI0_ARTOA|nr:hypothetical protein AOL_s00006g31 [Orbilia oligospora ATCC 24927]EGX53703.1 hypothetical protein AOL_s00006g31 [Orbilia oligospora ATCC 24927]KAF3272945.1 hypothetical protein TWF970_009842 [Orbilia oligospora]